MKRKQLILIFYSLEKYVAMVFIATMFLGYWEGALTESGSLILVIWTTIMATLIVFGYLYVLSTKTQRPDIGIRGYGMAIIFATLTIMGFEVFFGAGL